MEPSSNETMRAGDNLQMQTTAVTERAIASPVESGTTSEINLSTLIDSRRLGALQLRIIALCGLVMLVDGFNTQIIGYIAPLIAKEWGMPRSALGPIFSLGLAGLMVGRVTITGVQYTT